MCGGVVGVVSQSVYTNINLGEKELLPKCGEILSLF